MTFLFRNKEGNNFFRQAKIGCPSLECHSIISLLKDLSHCKAFGIFSASSSKINKPSNSLALSILVPKHSSWNTLWVWGNLAQQFRWRVSLLMEIKLQNKLETCRTDFRTRLFERTIAPFPTTKERPICYFNLLMSRTCSISGEKI